MSGLNLDAIETRYREYATAVRDRGYHAGFFVAAVAADVPALLFEVELLREQNANLREQLDRVNAGRQTLAEELAGGEPR